LKFIAPLRAEKVDAVPADGEYVGLEQMQSWTGRLSGAELERAPEGAANVFHAGDVLFGKLRPYLAKAWVADRSGYSTTEALVLSPRSADARFVRYCLLAPEFVHAVDCSTYGSKMPRADWGFVGAVQLPCPALAEQQRIANFLDEQTARIDALIAEKTELAERLAELSQSTIADEILGRGAAKRQPTNVRELGDMPSGWVVAPMMRLTDPSRPIMYGIVLPGPNVEEGPSVPIVKGGDVRPQRLRLELLNRTTPEIELPYARARLREGDIVYSIRGTIGDAELVPAELTGANITQDVARISPRRDVDGRWLLYAAKSRPVFAQLEQLSLGAAVRGINIFDLKRAKVPTPPIAVQRLIADKLDTLIARFHALQKHSLAHIALLREYRSSLISAAVTGQLDVGAYRLLKSSPSRR
jgi:type I restriction enzyme S subunit